MYQIEYKDEIIKFNIIRKAKLKNTYIQINNSGVLIKTNNFTTLKDINKMVQKKSSWIIKKLNLFKSIPLKEEIANGFKLYYMGRSYSIEITKDKSNKEIQIKFAYSKFYITTPLKYKKIDLDKAIEKFYKQKAKEKIIPISKKWATIMGVTPEYISFRFAKTKWGSCSSVNHISFNYHLIKLPSLLVEYVVIHELAHIIHKNHSKEFWKEVQNYIPDYKIRQDKIRTFEKLI